MVRFSIIIPTYNSRGCVVNCLNSVFNQDFPEAEVILVDNASSDGTAEFVKREYPGVRIIENKVNFGASRARNQGLPISRGEWVLFLDCDTVLGKDFLREAFRLINSLPAETGTIQPKILDAEGKNIYSAGIRMDFLKRFHDLGRGLADASGFNNSGPVFGACCAAALYRRKMLEEIKDAYGYFDKRMFFIFEDADLSWRGQKKGWKCLFYPRLKCFHRGNSSAAGKPVRRYLSFRNRHLTILKNQSFAGIILMLPLYLVYDLPRMFILFFESGKRRADTEREKIRFQERRVTEKVSAIVVTAGAKDYLKHCLDSLLIQSYPVHEIIVIDNSPSSAVSRNLGGAYPSVKFLAGSQDLFYGAGLNKGIALSGGDFILCLNDDLILDMDFIQQGCRGFLAHEMVGLVSGKILRRDRKTIDSAGLFLTAWLTAGERGYGKKGFGRFERPGFIFGVSGSAAFYRREMLEEIKEKNGFFDPEMKMFYEDLDISWRAKKAGWCAYYIPLAVAYHVRGGSFRPDSGLDKPFARRYLDDNLHYELIKNRYRTILKNGNALNLLPRLIPVFIYELIAWGYILLFCPGVLRIFLTGRGPRKSSA
ncbi:MAG: glycosyltransferase family 2 protein [Candidatus Omnitrophota bacterium]